MPRGRWLVRKPSSPADPLAGRQLLRERKGKAATPARSFGYVGNKHQPSDYFSLKPVQMPSYI